jgi:glycosyltransferase involved in cell wall biosynthesis
MKPTGSHDGDTREPPQASPAPQISVIIPVYNAESTLGVQLEALRRQAFAGSWEVIVADNGSTDRSLAVAERFALQLPLRIVPATAMRGAGHARNVGARSARASLLAFVDADDEVAPGWLQAIVKSLRHHAVVASRFDKERLNAPEIRATRQMLQQFGLNPSSYARFLPHVGGSGLAVRRSVHLALGGFDESLLRLQDTDYSWRLQLAGHTIHFEREAVLHVRFREGNGSALRQAFLYGRYYGRRYNRYVHRGMARVPLLGDLEQIVVRAVRLATTRDAADHAKRARSLANLVGIVLGRLESWRPGRRGSPSLERHGAELRTGSLEP